MILVHNVLSTCFEKYCPDISEHSLRNAPEQQTTLLSDGPYQIVISEEHTLREKFPS